MTIFDFKDGKGPVPAHQHPYGCGWVADTTQVAATAMVSGNAMVYGNAIVSDNAMVSDNALVYGDAMVSGNARVSDNALVYGNSRVYGDAMVYGNSRVYGDAMVSENAMVYGDAWVYGNAMVSGNARVYGEAWVSEGILKVDIKQNIMVDILAQTGLVCKEDHVIAYKRVCANLTSDYDSDFQYVVGKWISDPNAEESNRSCAPGLHVSNANYYAKEFSDESKLILECKVMLEDIITVQEGKIRCRKLFVERVAF